MASSSDTDYLPLPGATSEVWKYFGFPAINGKHSNEYLSYILFIIIIIIGKFIEPDKKPDTPNSFQIVEFSLSSSIYRHTVRKKNETGNAHRLTAAILRRCYATT